MIIIVSNLISILDDNLIIDDEFIDDEIYD